MNTNTGNEVIAPECGDAGLSVLCRLVSDEEEEGVLQHATVNILFELHFLKE
jgi:hypothetical protein